MKNVQKLMPYFADHWRSILLALLTIMIFLVPNLFWGNLYSVGGDDGRFYYIFPLDYLKNFSFNIISNNTLGGNMGYLPVSYSAPTIFVLYLIKTLFSGLNTQLIAYGLILSIGFLYMYLFLNEVVSSKSIYLYWGRVVASVYYIFSIYLTKTFYQHQLISMYSIMVLPVCLYLFIVGVKKKSYAYIIASSLFYSIFSSTLYGLPWLLPAIFTLIPFLLYIQKNYRSMFLRSIVLFILFTLLCNTYWLIHYIIPLLTKSGSDVFTNHLLSESYREQNNAAIAAITRLNAPVNQLVNHLRTSWMDRESVTILESIGVVYLMVILFAGSLLRLVRRSAQIIFLTVLSGFCIALFFVTPNFGELNLRVFQFLNNTIPFFVMFRNMYDKFALATAFQFSFAIYVALYIFNEARIKNSIKYAVLILIVIVTSIKMYPYVKIDYKDSLYSTRISGKLNPEFISMMKYIEQMDTTSRFLWYPMTYPGYVFIQDSAGSQNFYTGLSPMQILAQKSDIAGYYGIQTPSNPTLHASIYEYLRDHNYDAVGKKLQEQHIGYIIENKELPDVSALKFLDENGFMSSQSSEYLRAVSGEKIKDFGTSYTLYAIADKFQSPTVYLTDDIKTLVKNQTAVTFKRSGNISYTVSIDRISSLQYLVFLEPYNPLWKMRIRSGKKTITLPVKPSRAFDYGNTWKLSPTDLVAQYPDMIGKNSDGSYSMNLEIVFSPNDYTLPALIFSIVIGIIGIVYIFLHV